MDGSRRKPDGSGEAPPPGADDAPSADEEPRAAPMKQDFHFYVRDHRDEAERACRRQREVPGGEGQEGRELRRLATRLNARLLRGWAAASPAARAACLAREEADRGRFAKEEAAARRGVGPAAAATVPLPSSAADALASKRPRGRGGEKDGERAAKRGKAV